MPRDWSGLKRRTNRCTLRPSCPAPRTRYEPFLCCPLGQLVMALTHHSQVRSAWRKLTTWSSPVGRKYYRPPARERYGQPFSSSGRSSISRRLRKRHLTQLDHYSSGTYPSQYGSVRPPSFHPPHTQSMRSGEPHLTAVTGRSEGPYSSAYQAPYGHTSTRVGKKPCWLSRLGRRRDRRATPALTTQAHYANVATASRPPPYGHCGPSPPQWPYARHPYQTYVSGPSQPTFPQHGYSIAAQSSAWSRPPTQPGTGSGVSSKKGWFRRKAEEAKPPKYPGPVYDD